MRAFRTMSSISVASLQRMKAQKLAETLRAEQAAGVAPADSRVAVVDVRDSGEYPISFLGGGGCPARPSGPPPSFLFF